MEKKVMVRLCAKIVAETALYETDKEVENREVIVAIKNVWCGGRCVLYYCGKLLDTVLQSKLKVSSYRGKICETIF